MHIYIMHIEQVSRDGMSPLDIAAGGNNGVLMDLLARAVDVITEGYVCMYVCVCVHVCMCVCVCIYIYIHVCMM